MPRRQVSCTASPTLDERFVEAHPETVLRMLRQRQAPRQQFDAVMRVGELNRARAALVEVGNAARSERKRLSPEVGALLKSGDIQGAEALKERVASSNEAADRAGVKQEQLEAERSTLFDQLPNLLDESTPEGVDEQDNVLVSSWGCDGELPSNRLWHDEVGKALGGLDLEAGAKLSGARFAVLRGSLARLERALINLFMDVHTEKHGYTEVSVPLLVGRDALHGTGQLPKFEEDLFRLDAPLNGRQGYLIPTAEVPLTNMHAEEILQESQLPLSYVAATPCFRSEAGHNGKDTRGLFRQHQFHKVELVKICTPEQATAEHDKLVGHAEACLQMLELPHRKMLLCSADVGFSARKCYDLEVWLPGPGRFREISSCSNCGDFQARRMGLRYRPASRNAGGKQSKPAFCYTLNGSGLAIGRTLVAILENYQNEDGSLTVPKALLPYMGGVERVLPLSAGGKQVLA